MNDRLTDGELQRLADDPIEVALISGYAVDALVAEAREHRATIGRVRALVQTWRAEQDATESDMDMLQALADEIEAALDAER